MLHTGRWTSSETRTNLLLKRWNTSICKYAGASCEVKPELFVASAGITSRVQSRISTQTYKVCSSAQVSGGMWTLWHHLSALIFKSSPTFFNRRTQEKKLTGIPHEIRDS